MKTRMNFNSLLSNIAAGKNKPNAVYKIYKFIEVYPDVNYKAISEYVGIPAATVTARLNEMKYDYQCIYVSKTVDNMDCFKVNYEGVINHRPLSEVEKLQGKIKGLITALEDEPCLFESSKVIVILKSLLS